MPISPETGLYQQSEGSLFPNGMFGNALSVNNAQIAQKLSEEAASKRALESHMMELQGQNLENEMNARTKDRQWEEKTRGKQEQWEELVRSNPGASTEWLSKQAMGYGVKDTSLLSNQLYKEGMLANKSSQTEVKNNEVLKSTVQGFVDKGVPASQFVPALRANPMWSDPIYSAYFDKLEQVSQAPEVTSKIAERATKGVLNTAQAGKANRAPATGTASSAKAEAVLRDYDKRLGESEKQLIKLDSPMEKNQYKRKVIEPLRAERDAFALKHGLGGAGSPTPPPKVQPPPNPSPSTTTLAPPAPPEPKLKPNWTYKINGKIVTTDSNGEIVQ